MRLVGCLTSHRRSDDFWEMFMKRTACTQKEEIKMFPLREKKYKNQLILIILILIEISIISVTFLANHRPIVKMENQQNTNEQKTNTIYLEGLKDNGEPITVRATSTDITLLTEKLDKLAAEYNADPEYLNYIVQVEKTFDLEPCELLALIAQESGFIPQTRMDGGSLSYSTTQMKLLTAKTAYMAITEYYKMDIPYPTHELLQDNKYYAAFLAGGYLRYLNNTYKDKYESYTAYNWGIGGRMIFFNNNGNFKSPYAIKVASLGKSFVEYVGKEYAYSSSINPEGIDFRI